ncbi:MAG: hypothetical protein P1U74_08600 [Legionellaceae bacterium]|nr:hypothetical protein [Legionellaceae bacterium]
MKKPKLSEKSPAIIIFLYGTSTSGKTTICKALKNLISDLKIDGTDSAYERLEGHNFEKIFKYFNENKNQFPDIKDLQTTFTVDEICNGILGKQIDINNKKVALTLDLDKSTFERMLEETFGSEFLIEKKAITTLRVIAKSYFNQLSMTAYENMCLLAIRNSLQGVPTVLDIVPHPGRSSQYRIDLFQEKLRRQNLSSSLHIALIHCSINQLSSRMVERNRQAIINDDLENIRDESFPFRQYAQLFGTVNNSKNKQIGQLKREEAIKEIAPFCTNFDEVNEIIEKIGLISPLDEINISPKCSFDKLYDSSSEPAEKIAQNICKTWGNYSIRKDIQ